MYIEAVETPLCPVCGEGHLSARTTSEEVEFAGVKGFINLQSSACDTCGSVVAGRAESQANKRSMTAFKKQAKGMVTGEAIRQWRGGLDITQELVAQMLGGGKVAFSRYENDDVIQTEAMDNLLYVCMQNPANLLLLAKRKGLGLSPALRRKINGSFFGRVLALEVTRTLDADLAKKLPLVQPCANDDMHVRPRVIPFRMKAAAA